MKKLIKKKPDVKKDVKEVIEAADEEPQKISKDIKWDRVLSTGSTLLDLAISGTKIRGGGLPGGIIVEVFGPPSTGKTAILAEVAGYAQSRGGDIMFGDPEARLDSEYARIYGIKLQAKNYSRPDTVNEIFDSIWNWRPEPTDKDAINVICVDSLAALSTEMEMDDEDKMGMKRGKDFSTGLRKTCRLIAKNNHLIVCSNQEREGTGGTFTPGGKSVPYYSSMRIRVKPGYPKRAITRTRKVGEKKRIIEQEIGIVSTCQIIKSSLDIPRRTAQIYIVYNYGIDDIRSNLQWYKEIKGLDSYYCVDKEYKVMESAIRYIEDNDLQHDLKEIVIDEWENIQKMFETERKPKAR